ncbi:MAG: hypothetical protein RR685_06410 [Hungatella sp.]
MKNKTIWFRKAMILLFWLAVWQGIALLIHNRIIFVGPAEMVQSLVRQLTSPGFWQTIAHSFGKISLGFLSAFFLGIVLGSAGYRFPLLQELLEPIILLMKSVPVASFVILALIWIGAKQLSILIAFLVVFPMIYIISSTYC